MLPLYRWKRRPATDIVSDSKGRCGGGSVTGGVKGSPRPGQEKSSQLSGLYSSATNLNLVAQTF